MDTPGCPRFSRLERLVLLQILVKNLEHGDIPNARIVQLLEREASDGQPRKQPLTRGIAKLISSGQFAGKLEPGAKQRACGAEAGGSRIMGVDRSTVARERDVSLGSASLVVDELTGPDDDLMNEKLCHSAFFACNRGVYEK